MVDDNHVCDSHCYHYCPDTSPVPASGGEPPLKWHAGHVAGCMSTFSKPGVNCKCASPEPPKVEAEKVEAPGALPKCPKCGEQNMWADAEKGKGRFVECLECDFIIHIDRFFPPTAPQLLPVESIAREIALYVRGELCKPLVCKPENDYLTHGIIAILRKHAAKDAPKETA